MSEPLPPAPKLVKVTLVDFIFAGAGKGWAETLRLEEGDTFTEDAGGWTIFIQKQNMQVRLERAHVAMFARVDRVLQEAPELYVPTEHKEKEALAKKRVGGQPIH